MFGESSLRRINNSKSPHEPSGSICLQPGTSCRLSTPIAGRAAALQSQGKQSARVLHTPTMKGDTQGMRQSPYRKQEGHDNFPSRQRRSSWQLCGGRCSCEQQSQSDGSWAPQRSLHSHPSTGLSCSSLCRACCGQSCGGLALSASPLPGCHCPRQPSHPAPRLDPTPAKQCPGAVSQPKTSCPTSALRRSPEAHLYHIRATVSCAIPV